MRRSRIASTTGGTCSFRPRTRAGTYSGTPTRARRRDTSRRRLREHLVDAFAEPVEAVRSDSFGKARLRDQHVVAPGRDAFETSAPDLAQLPLDAVARDGVPGGLRHSESEPRIPGLFVTV